MFNKISISFLLLEMYSWIKIVNKIKNEKFFEVFFFEFLQHQKQRIKMKKILGSIIQTNISYYLLFLSISPYLKLSQVPTTSARSANWNRGLGTGCLDPRPLSVRNATFDRLARFCKKIKNRQSMEMKVRDNDMEKNIFFYT